MIFSHVLYQLSYLGAHLQRRMPLRAERPLTVAILAVHPAGELLLIGWRAGDAIALAEPFQEIAIAAAGTAKWRMLL